MKIENPQAFPWCGDLNTCPTINLGMTLRDYFAGQALTSATMLLIKAIETGDLKETATEKTMAQQAYATADAMLVARGDA